MISNKRHIYELPTKYSMTERTTIAPEIEHSFEIFEMRGKSSLVQYEAYSSSLLAFLHRSYPIKLSEMVVDFLKDEKGDIWFIGVKAFNVDSAAIPKLMLKSEDDHLLSKEEKEEAIKEKTANSRKKIK